MMFNFLKKEKGFKPKDTTEQFMYQAIHNKVFQMFFDVGMMFNVISSYQDLKKETEYWLNKKIKNKNDLIKMYQALKVSQKISMRWQNVRSH